MKLPISIAVIVLFLTLVIALELDAQQAGYVIRFETIGSGGGVAIGGDYKMQGTVGQPNVNVLQNDDYRLISGFWHPIDSLPSPRNIYLPAQEVVPGNRWKAGIQVQNVGTESADISYSGVAQNGIEVECGSEQTPPGGSANFLTDLDCPAGHPPFAAGVTRSAQPGVAIANVYNKGVGVAGGQYRGTSSEGASKHIFFPLVKHNHVGRTTSFSVQNASDKRNDITAVFKINGRLFTKEYKDVPAFASVLVMPVDAGVPGGTGQVGSLSLTGSQPLAGASLEYEHGAAAAQNLQTANAFSPTEYDTVLYCPLYRNAHAATKQTSGVQVQNVDTVSRTVSLTYSPVGGGSRLTSSQQVEPGASTTFYAPAIGIPKGSVGSVSITSQGDIVAVVNEGGREANGRRIMTTYSCFPAGSTSTTVMIPLYKEHYLGNTSGIQVQNVAGDGSAATIEVTYQATNSSDQATFSHNIPIPDGGSITFWSVSNLSSPSGILSLSGDPAALKGTFGSVMITSDKPIVAIANETSFGPNSSGQDSKNYEGFNQ